MNPWQHIAEHIQRCTGVVVQPARDSIGGGCINAAARLRGAGGDFFVKTNQARQHDMFVAEAEGLRELAAAAAIRVPQPICDGIAGDTAYLVLEYLDLHGRGAAAVLGEHLAALHRVTQKQFGWRRDNTIGATEQRNAPCDDWLAFWREQRLGFQLQLAQRNGCGTELLRLGEALLLSLEDFFPGYRPQASLLHGDLWSGNHAYLADGIPVIFDPAVYFGDREADLAMTELFGGYGAEFHAAYRAQWPLDAGYKVRKTLYNLYHIINHFNLFGGGYQQQAVAMLRQLHAELR